MKSTIIQSFGQRIKSLRENLSLSQEKLAEITGFHRTYIGMIERGERNPSLKNIAVFAEAFSMNLNELFKGVK
jgi:transcriptional regulator with XRE-family HTH domain